jgi:nucleotide-binding universal stress UspA family protein
MTLSHGPEHLSHAPRTGTTGPQRILAATDLGPIGDSAIKIAYARMCETGGRLAICHVIQDPPSDQDAALKRIAEVHRELTRVLKAEIGEHADEVEVFVPVGDPARQIHDCAEAWQAELVVLGRPEHAHGLLARLFKPNVVDKVVRWASCAILVTRPSPGTRRIVVGTDFSDPSMPVLAAAADEQRRTGASVYAVHCVPPASFMPIGDPAAGVMPAVAWEEIEEAMRHKLEECSREAGLRAAPQIVALSASDGLVQIAKDLSADMVIVGTHGRKGVARLAFGSVAQHVVDHAPCPVLVVPLHAGG